MTKVYVPAGMVLTFEPSGNLRLMTYALWRPTLPTRIWFAELFAGGEVNAHAARSGIPQHASRPASALTSLPRIRTLDDHRQLFRRRENRM